MSPFEALYGYKPPNLTLEAYAFTTVAGIDDLLQQRKTIQLQLKHNLRQAQERMKAYADKQRCEQKFAIGDWVYLKLKPYRQRSLHRSRLWKLSPKFAGPFQVIEHVGEVAYKLKLPAEARLHPVFHVSLLKRKVGTTDNVVASLPHFDDEGKVILHPIAILARRLVKRNNNPVPQLLIQWAHLPEQEATWEDYYTITQQFPHLQS